MIITITMMITIGAARAEALAVAAPGAGGRGDPGGCPNIHSDIVLLVSIVIVIVLTI